MKKLYYRTITWIVGKTHYPGYRILPKKIDGWLFGQMIIGKCKGYLDQLRLLEYVEHFKGVTLNAVKWSESLTQRIASDVETQEPKSNGNGIDETPFQNCSVKQGYHHSW